MSGKRCFLVAIAVFSAALCVGSLHAGVFDTVNEAENLYGQAVHAYFDGDYEGAVNLLTHVDELDPKNLYKDPRPYFFLGLAYCQLRQTELADEAFKKAAKIEQESLAARDFDVSGALRRIQGAQRLRIEEYRKEAKSVREEKEQKSFEVKYRETESERRHRILQGMAAPALQRPFIGQAPFGARSVDPFREPDGAEDPDKLIPTDDKSPASLPKPEKAEEANEKPDEPTPMAMPDKPKADDKDPFETPDGDKKEEPAVMTTPDKPKADDKDPFETPTDDKKEDSDEMATPDEPKADEKKPDEPKKDDDDNPFK